MNMNRRHFVRNLGTASICGGALPLALASTESYPSRPIQFIVGNAAGSPPDVRVREMAEVMTRNLGQPIIVMNKPGAGGLLAARQVARSDPDGYNLLSLSFNHLISELLAPGEAPILNSLEVITNCSAAPLILYVNPEKVAARNAREFVEYARANPNKITYGTGGPGSIEQLYGKLLFGALGIQLTEVPYPAATRAISDVLGGTLDAGFAYVVTVGQYLATRRLHAIGIGSSGRLDAVPNVPTFKEQGFDAPSLMAWQGLAVPKGTPASIVSQLYRSTAAALKDPQLREHWTSQGAVMGGEPPDAYREFVKSQRTMLQDVIQRYGLKL